MKINEESTKNKYKYYRADMLMSILKENKNLPPEEMAIIEEIIKEKANKLKPDDNDQEPIIYGGIKDKLILAARWHILIASASMLISFIYRQRYYPWGWIEALFACVSVFAFGLVGASITLIFFTKQSKGLFYKNYIKFSLVGIAILFVVNWNYCRISYTCN